MIVGVDEVGRGCWAGPVVAGAVVLGAPIAGLRDSKKLTKRQRERLDAEIRLSAAAFGLGWVHAEEIDKIGLGPAVGLAMRRALEKLDKILLEVDEIILDGNYNFLAAFDPRAVAIVKADDSVPVVSAASIIAKVARDRYMQEAHIQFPKYGFDRHVGYGTPAHIAALNTFGPCAQHRRSYKPIAALAI